MELIRSTPGVDKVKLFTSDFYVKDVTGSGLLLMPGTVDLGTGTTVEHVLFRDRSAGNVVKGSKAIRNTELYNLTVNEHGLTVTFNPSKPYHPFNLVDDDDVLYSRFTNVKTDLEKHGIYAGWMDAKVTRLDVSRNVTLDGSVRSYGSVWPWFKMKRSKHVRQYPDGYGTGNDTVGMIFYDKGKESVDESGNRHYDGDNLLRGEIQFKRNKAVRNRFGCQTFGQVRELGLTAVGDIYREQMSKVFRLVDGMNQFTIDFQNEVDVLKHLREQNDRTAVSVHFKLMSVPSFLERYGTPDVYADVLRASGFSKMSIDRNVKTIRELILLYDTVYRNKQNTVGKLIRELCFKLAA